MKNTMKRAFSVLLTLTMLLTICCTAFAAEATEPTTPVQTGSLTISGTAEVKDCTAEAYRLFTIEKKTETVIGADGTSSEKNTYIYKLYDKYKGFFSNELLGFQADDEINDIQRSEAAYQYVLNLNTGEDKATKIKNFANSFITWIREQGLSVDENKVATMTAVEGDATKTTATIDKVPYGYYLVFVGHAPASLVNVINETNEVKVKSEHPTVDKTIGANTEAIAREIGETVKFTLTSAVPDMAGYNSYKFKFVDTMSDGLTYNKDVAVAIGGETLTTGYTATHTGNTLTVEIDNMIERADQVGAPIGVTYTATVNENAIVAGPNENEAVVVYSNDPSDPTKMGTSTPEVVEVYTFDINVKKVAHGTNALLAGATFKLCRNNTTDAVAVPLVKVADNEYRLAKTTDSGVLTEADGITTVDTVTTDATGIINIKGLTKGTYYLVETNAPANYTQLTDPVKVTIDVTYNPDGTLQGWYVNNSTSGDNIVTVENRSGTTLPETGAIGTAIFAIVGVGLVIGGTQLMARKKKHNESEQ